MLSPADVSRNAKNSAATGDLRRAAIRILTKHQASYPLFFKAIRTKLKLTFPEVSFDNLPADSLIPLGRAMEDDATVCQAIVRGVKNASSSGAKWVEVVLSSFEPGVLDSAAARLVRSGALDLSSLSRFECVYGVFPMTAVLMELLARDFHPTFDDAASRLNVAVRGATMLDERGGVDLVATEVRVRSLVGACVRDRELIDYNGLTESFAMAITCMDPLNPVGPYPRLNESWAVLFDLASDVVFERSQDKIKQFRESDFDKLSDAFEELARQVLHIAGRRELTGKGTLAVKPEVRAISAAAATAGFWTAPSSPEEEASRHYERLGREYEAYAMQFSPQSGAAAETALCEHGCGKPIRNDAPSCNNCGRDKKSSWVCRLCSRVSARDDNHCRNRYQGCDGTKAAGRPVDTSPGSPDAQKAARGWQARLEERQSREVSQPGKGNQGKGKGGGGKGQAQQPRPRGGPGSYGGGGPLRLTN
jgi:hypothetical protein